MMEINLIDESFRHLATPSGVYSMIHEKKPKHITWVRDRLEYDGITIFTDVHLNSRSISSVRSKYKIGWFLENVNVSPPAYHNVNSYADMLDLILTNDIELLRKYPNKAKFVPFGGGWIKQENFGIKKKTKLASIIYSNKNQFEGHRLRHQIANKYSDVIDLFGNGSPNPIGYKEEALSDYMFTIAIENVSNENYFTEKIVDPLLLGTIPIYWGCDNIGQFFSNTGIVKFETIEDFDVLLKSLSRDLYKGMSKGIEQNYKLALEYEITEDWIYQNILKELVK